MVVAQLAERTHPTPEVCSSNPVIGNILHRPFIYYQLNRKDENKDKKKAGIERTIEKILRIVSEIV